MPTVLFFAVDHHFLCVVMQAIQERTQPQLCRRLYCFISTRSNSFKGILLNHFILIFFQLNFQIQPSFILLHYQSLTKKQLQNFVILTLGLSRLPSYAPKSIGLRTQLQLLLCFHHLEKPFRSFKLELVFSTDFISSLDVQASLSLQFCALGA